jgi:hypothetical protein
MKLSTYPLAMPADLQREVKATAAAVGVSMADAMRQAIKLGLPKLRETMASSSLAPISARALQAAYAAETPAERQEAARLARASARPRPEDFA